MSVRIASWGDGLSGRETEGFIYAFITIPSIPVPTEPPSQRRPTATVERLQLASYTALSVSDQRGDPPWLSGRVGADLQVAVTTD